MTDDTPRKGEPGAHGPVPQCKVVGDTAMPSGDCNCDGDDDRLPYAVAACAIQKDNVPDERLLEFRRELRAMICPPHETIAYNDLYALLQRYAYRPIWGRGHRQTLAYDVGDQISRRRRVPPEQELYGLNDITHSFVQQGVNLRQQRKAYKPTMAKDPLRAPSLRTFAFERTWRVMLRLWKKEQMQVPTDEVELPAVDQEIRRSGRRAEDVPHILTQRSGEKEFDVFLFHNAIREVQKLIPPSRELELLALLGKVMARAKTTELQQTNYTKALEVLKRALEGEPGHCIFLDSAIGAESDCPPLMLATHVSGEAALPYGSVAATNATEFNKQVAGWLDKLLGKACDDPEYAGPARELVLVILAQRALSHTLLCTLTEKVCRLDGADPTLAAELWLGRPGRDRTDGANGTRGVHGVGIAQIPFLFALLDPIGEQSTGLARLIAARED